MRQAPRAPSAGACPAACVPAPAGNGAGLGHGARREGGRRHHGATGSRSWLQHGAELNAPGTADRPSVSG
eukprot:4033453-Lingulodinium_polyedra.AAC.1